MENRESNTESLVNGYFTIMITQGICVLLLLLSVVCIKYFFKEAYFDLKEFYKNEICSVTDINEVMTQRGENV